jgi:ABC-type Mn2+/Zn2+ transport system permease subunit
LVACTSFDPGFARGLGFPAGLLDKLLMLLIVIAVVAGIQTQTRYSTKQA